MKIEILGIPDCPNYAAALERTQAVLENIGIQAAIEEYEINTDEAAIQARFPGSPTIRVDGLDVEIAARRLQHFGVGCRTYVANGKRQGLPPQQWIEDTIREAQQKGGTQA